MQTLRGDCNKILSVTINKIYVRMCVASKRRKIVIANLYNASGTGSDIFSYNTGHRNSTNIQHDHIDRYNIENHPQKRNARLLYMKRIEESIVLV